MAAEQTQTTGGYDGQEPPAMQGPFVPASSLNGREFDFIIVGAGSAGCRLAHRLTEKGKATVLLIEAGSDEGQPMLVDDYTVRSVPGTHLSLHGHPKTDWCFRTEKQKHVFQDRNEPGVAPYHRGKGPGGSGGINFMMWVRGAKQDFDTWARLGAEGWSAKDCLPYFMKAEDVSEAITDGLQADPTQRGTEGVTKVSHGLGGGFRTDPIIKETFACMKEAGFTIGDYNDFQNHDNPSWAGQMQYTIKDGVRSAPDTILRKRMAEGSAPGLTFATGGHVTSLLFSENGKSARGVRLVDATSGAQVEVTARKETIMSAGATGSPQVLMLSGIGPRDHLESVGIECNTNLPVGQNLSDHLYMLYRAVGGALLTEAAVYGTAEQIGVPEEVGKYMEKKQGLLAKVCGDFSAFTSPLGTRSDGGPDLQIIPFTAPLGDAAWKNSTDAEEGKGGVVGGELEPTLVMCCSIAQPKSRGTVTLRSKDPFAAPVIDHRFYDNPADRELHVAAYRTVEGLFGPGSKGAFKDTKSWRPDVKTDDDIREYLKKGSFHGWHACGTCRMGQQDDPAAVVDPSLRVRGVDGLRVIDVSVFPVVTSGNTNASVIMVAEKGADIIKRAHAELFA